jgi:phosphohistidine phosphatase
MLTLTLFRHAKSSWHHPSLDDIDRPLAPRGEKAAPQMAAYMAEHGLVPDLVLCSPSRRTRQTLALALPKWTAHPKIDYAEALYLASVPTLFTIIRATPADRRHLMVIGHNPGMEMFARHVIGSGEAKARQALAAKFPTAAVAVITWDCESWADIEPGGGRLALFVTPKQLGRNKDVD